MKTIRLLYPDYVSGGLDTYYFGANLLQHILPANPNQPVVPVDITPPDGRGKSVTNGIYGESEVLAGIRSAQDKLAQEQPDRVITIGGNCMVSLAPFDYLHVIETNADMVGFTIAEYLPFDEHKLHNMFAGVSLLTGE